VAATHPPTLILPSSAPATVCSVPATPPLTVTLARGEMLPVIESSPPAAMPPVPLIEMDPVSGCPVVSVPPSPPAIVVVPWLFPR